MKTSFFIYAMIVVGGWVCIPNCHGQDNKEDEHQGIGDYDVQRVYDKEGNLLYYDSTLVTAEIADYGDPEFDSLLSAWKNEDRIVNYSVRFPKDSFSYSFQLPDGFFDFAPEYEFDIEVPDFDSLLKGFDYYFSITPTDSCREKHRDKPFFEFHGKVPEIDPDLDARMWEMERRMLEFQDKVIREYEEWEKGEKMEKKKEKNPPPPPPPPAEPAKPSEPIDI